MVTATDGSPARRGGARAMGKLALLGLSACLSNPPGVRGVAGTAPAPNVFWTPPQERAPRDTTRATPSPFLPPDLAPRVQALTLTDIVVSVTVSALLLAIGIEAHKRAQSWDPERLRPMSG